MTIDSEKVRLSRGHLVSIALPETRGRPVTYSGLPLPVAIACSPTAAARLFDTPPEMQRLVYSKIERAVGDLDVNNGARCGMTWGKLAKRLKARADVPVLPLSVETSVTINKFSCFQQGDLYLMTLYSPLLRETQVGVDAVVIGAHNTITPHWSELSASPEKREQYLERLVDDYYSAEVEAQRHFSPGHKQYVYLPPAYRLLTRSGMMTPARV